MKNKWSKTSALISFCLFLILILFSFQTIFHLTFVLYSYGNCGCNINVRFLNKTWEKDFLFYFILKMFWKILSTLFRSLLIKKSLTHFVLKVYVLFIAECITYWIMQTLWYEEHPFNTNSLKLLLQSNFFTQ